MDSVKKPLKKLYTWLSKEGRTAFLTAFALGLLTHVVMLLSDIPNHDGLDSMYFDQNMITSGRWFLEIACGISSFYLLPWLSGLLSIVYLSMTAVLLVKLLDVNDSILSALIAGLLVTFPTLTSNFAYVFTMDGYMIGLLLSVLSVYLVRSKKGFLFGGLALAFSMGTYQAYLSVAILLCLYEIMLSLFEDSTLKEKVKNALNYLLMGITGATLYYVILRVLLFIQGKELDTYQGINGMAGASSINLKEIYTDFVSFLLKGNVIFNNVFGLAAVIALLTAFIASFIYLAIKKGLLKKPYFYISLLIVLLIIPVATNVILIVSPGVTYHAIMRYQYGLFGILALAFIGKVLKEYSDLKTLAWISVASGAVLIFTYMLTCNVAYSNLTKKYEKTYAYCLRLADRIEQTEGYYEGIPIYMIGVVGDDNFPSTDITGDVTDHLIGINGDWLLYTSENYELFYKYYMGITFNFLSPDEANYYDTDEYIALSSFPLEGCTKVVDGVLYVKTENMH